MPGSTELSWKANGRVIMPDPIMPLDHKPKLRHPTHERQDVRNNTYAPEKNDACKHGSKGARLKGLSSTSTTSHSQPVAHTLPEELVLFGQGGGNIIIEPSLHD
eukprot:4889065-Amphidinium_carterae.2